MPLEAASYADQRRTEALPVAAALRREARPAPALAIGAGEGDPAADWAALPGAGALGEYWIKQPSDPYRQYSIKWDGEWQITYETFRDMGAAYAVAVVGGAAMGAVAEKPEIAGQALIFIALAEGLVVFGFITALMILGKV